MSDKELRARAEKLADKLGLLPKPTPHVPYERMRNDIDAIFRELVAVRDQSCVKIKYSTRPPLEIPNY